MLLGPSVALGVDVQNQGGPVVLPEGSLEGTVVPLERGQGNGSGYNLNHHHLTWLNEQMGCDRVLPRGRVLCCGSSFILSRAPWRSRHSTSLWICMVPAGYQTIPRDVSGLSVRHRTLLRRRYARMGLIASTLPEW